MSLSIATEYPTIGSYICLKCSFDPTSGRIVGPLYTDLLKFPLDSCTSINKTSLKLIITGQKNADPSLGLFKMNGIG